MNAFHHLMNTVPFIECWIIFVRSVSNMSVRSIFGCSMTLLYHTTLHHPDSLDLLYIELRFHAWPVRCGMRKGASVEKQSNTALVPKRSSATATFFGTSSSGGQLLYRDRDTDSDERTTSSE